MSIFGSQSLGPPFELLDFERRERSAHDADSGHHTSAKVRY